MPEVTLKQDGIVVLVCGGRDYRDEKTIFGTLNRIHKEREIERVIHGDAKGADSLAFVWAVYAEVPSTRFRADWHIHGRAAGPLRNAQMLAEGKPNLVVAFPGGKGTADMVRQARATGVEVMEVQDGPASRVM